MDGPRGCCVEQNKSVRARQMPYDFIDMWDLKNKINEHAEEKQTHRYREHFDIWLLLNKRGAGGTGVKGEGIKYRLVVTE